MNTQPDYAAAWRDFRTRRIIFCAVFLSYMPGVFAIYFAVGLPLSALTGIKPDYFGLAIASCWMAAFAVTGWRVAGFSRPGVTSMHCGKSTNRVDRDARHEACSTRSRATSSTKPPAIATPREPARGDRHTARACTATKCGKAAPPLRTSDRGGATGHSSGNTAAFAVRREMELMRPWNSLRCYLYAFCNCHPQRSNELTTVDLSRASASGFDLGTSGETGFEQMLRPPFRVARNRGSGGCLAAGHLQ